MHARTRQFSHLVCTRQFSHLVSRQTVPPFSQGVYSSFFLISTHLPCLPKFVFLWGHQQNSCCVVLLLARGRVTALRQRTDLTDLVTFSYFTEWKWLLLVFPQWSPKVWDRWSRYFCSAVQMYWLILCFQNPANVAFSCSQMSSRSISVKYFVENTDFPYLDSDMTSKCDCFRLKELH